MLRVAGMLHDDYNYQQVNAFLNRSIKSYIKKVVCSPQVICQSDFTDVGISLRDEEKVHVNLLAVEAKKQASLVYCLYAITEAMRGR